MPSNFETQVQLTQSKGFTPFLCVTMMIWYHFWHVNEERYFVHFFFDHHLFKYMFRNEKLLNWKCNYVCVSFLVPERFPSRNIGQIHGKCCGMTTVLQANHRIESQVWCILIVIMSRWPSVRKRDKATSMCLSVATQDHNCNQEENTWRILQEVTILILMCRTVFFT